MAGAWLRERLPLEKLNYESLFQKKEVPVHAMSWGYYFGGLALFFLMIQVVTGFLLLFYYQPTLSRFYALHVVLLPFAIFSILGLHVFMVQLHGMSQGVDTPTRKTEKFFPIFALKDFSLWGVVFFVIFVVALCLPFEAFFSYPLFEPFDPQGSTPDGIKPEWYFFFIYYPLELLPFWLVMLLSTAGVAVLLLTPWIFHGSTRKTLRNIAIAATIYLVLMTVFGQQIYEFFKGAHP